LPYYADIAFKRYIKLIKNWTIINNIQILGVTQWFQDTVTTDETSLGYQELTTKSTKDTKDLEFGSRV